jgi:hypothetical protein
LIFAFSQQLGPQHGWPPSSCPFRVGRDPAVGSPDSAHPITKPLSAGLASCFLLPASCRSEDMQAPPLPFFSTVSLENNLQGHLLTGLANMVMLEGQGGATVLQAVLRQRGHGRHVLDNAMVVPVALVKSRRVSSSLVRPSGLGSWDLATTKYHSQLEICQVAAREPGCREPHCH